MDRPAGFDIVQRPKHYNAHPSGVECIEIIEHMTFNLGNATKYLWRGGLKVVGDACQDYQKALWYLQRSHENDTAFLVAGQAAMHFESIMFPRKCIFNRPSPWPEPIRNAIAAICDLHTGRSIQERIRLTDRAIACVKQAIADDRCLGRGMEP